MLLDRFLSVSECTHMFNLIKCSTVSQKYHFEHPISPMPLKINMYKQYHKSIAPPPASIPWQVNCRLVIRIMLYIYNYICHAIDSKFVGYIACDSLISLQMCTFDHFLALSKSIGARINAWVIPLCQGTVCKSFQIGRAGHTLLGKVVP